MSVKEIKEDAGSLSWHLVSNTYYMGFLDDTFVNFRNGTVEVQSQLRLGMTDFGYNYRKVKNFLRCVAKKQLFEDSVTSCKSHYEQEDPSLVGELEDLDHVSYDVTVPQAVQSHVTDEQLREWGFTEEDGVFKTDL